MAAEAATVAAAWLGAAPRRSDGLSIAVEAPSDPQACQVLLRVRAGERSGTVVAWLLDGGECQLTTEDEALADMVAAARVRRAAEPSDRVVRALEALLCEPEEDAASSEEEIWALEEHPAQMNGPLVEEAFSSDLPAGATASLDPEKRQLLLRVPLLATAADARLAWEQLGVDATAPLEVLVDAGAATILAVRQDSRHVSSESYAAACLLPRVAAACLAGDSELASKFDAAGGPLARLVAGLRAAVLEPRCPVCCARVPRGAGTGRLSSCGAPLCVDRFENAWVAAEAPAIGPLLRFSGQLELALACAACETGGAAFEPFPAFLLRRPESSRGRAGFMETGAIPSAENKADGVRRAAAALRAAITALPLAGHEADLRGLNPQGGARETKRPRLDSEQPISEPEDAYRLARFVLLTASVELLPVPSGAWLECAPCVQQLAVVSRPPPRWEERAAAAGTTLAFHGSGLQNWYSILRNGLRNMSGTAYMSTGAALGPGVYLTPKLGVAFKYARNSVALAAGVPGGAETRIVAVCEVLRDAPSKTEPYIVVPDPAAVRIRMLLLITGAETACVLTPDAVEAATRAAIAEARDGLQAR